MLYSPSDPDSNAQITTEIRDSTLKNFRSVLYNLLSNAIKYKSPSRGPQIHIKIKKEEGYVLLSVKDNELGIADEAKDQLFTPYTRFEKRVEGTGIGLYLVKKLLRMKEVRSLSKAS
ncbi:ATP-binding protein [Catalinimonas sp. 4WD22]|uniref:ATP-binding protein n=1 Tax=Catalinimonas locisalis TaxID=3133978 RepID=UPI00310139B7